MADSKLSDLATEATAPAPGDWFYIASGGTSKKMKVENFVLPVAVVSFSATPAFDANLGHVFRITLTGNITSWSISNAQNGQRISLVFVQDGAGGRSLAGAPGSVKLAGGSFPLTSVANKRDVLNLAYDGSDWFEESRSVNL